MGVLTQSTPPDTSFLLLSTLPWARAKAVRRASRKTKELSVLLTGGGWELSNGLCWNRGERKLDWISFLMGHKSTSLMEDTLDSGIWREPETVWNRHLSPCGCYGCLRCNRFYSVSPFPAVAMFWGKGKGRWMKETENEWEREFVCDWVWFIFVDIKLVNEWMLSIFSGSK